MQRLRELQRTPARGQRTVGQQLAVWLGMKRPSVRPSTARQYDAIIRARLGEHPRFMGLRLTELDSRSVAEWRDAMTAAGLSGSSVGAALTVLGMALKQAERDGLISRNPATGVAGPRVPAAARRTLSATEVRSIIAERGDPLRALWLVLVGCGLRIGEALALRWRDVDLERGLLHVTGSMSRGERTEPKTMAARRTLAMPAFVWAALSNRTHHAEQTDGPVFAGIHGRPLDPRWVSRQWHDYCARTGLPQIRLHDLRHTCATLLLGSGAPIDAVKRYMGHTSIAMTSDIYGHGGEDGMPGLAAVMTERLGR